MTLSLILSQNQTFNAKVEYHQEIEQGTQYGAYIYYANNNNPMFIIDVVEIGTPKVKDNIATVKIPKQYYNLYKYNKIIIVIIVLKTP